MAVNIRLNFWLIYDDFGISSVIWLVRIINDNLVRNDVLSWCIIPEFARTEERRPRESQIDRCLCRDFNLWPPQYETRVHHFCTPCILTCDFHNTRQECITCPCHSTVLTINRRISDKVVFVILDKHVRCEMCETVLERRVPRLTPHLSAAGLRENCRTWNTKFELLVPVFTRNLR